MRSKILRILAWTAAGLAVLLLALAGYGATRPREHEAARTVDLPQPPAELYAILVDVQAAPCWRPDLTSVDVVDDDHFVEHAEYGDVAYEVVERDPPRRLVVRITDEDLPYGGSWTYELQPAGTGTRLTITERGHIDGWLMRGMASLLMDPLASITGVQDALAAHQACD